VSEVPPTDGAVPPMPGAPAAGDVVAPEVPAAPRRRRRWPIVVGVVALLMVAGGAYAAWRLAGSGDVLLDTVPADADVVVTAYLDPAASQKLHLLRMLRRFPDTGSEEQIRQRVDEWLDQALEEFGLTHEDVGWVGAQALLWVDLRDVEDPGVAVVVAVDDADRARRAVDAVRDTIGEGAAVTETTHASATVSSTDDTAWAVTDDLLVIASDVAAVEATLDTAAGIAPSIATDDGFVAATGELPDESLGLVYIAFGDVMASLEEVLGTGQDPAELSVVEDLAMSVSATSDGLVVDAVTRYDPDADPAMLDELATTQENLALGAVPGDAVLTMAFTGLASGIEEGVASIEQQDPAIGEELARLGLTGPGGLLDALRGDLALGVFPTDADVLVGGVIALGVDDEAAVTSFVDGLIATVEESIASDCGPGCPPFEISVGEMDHDGVVISSLADETPPVAWAIHDGVALIGSTPDDVAAALDAMAAGDGIASTDRYAEAVGLVGGDQQLVLVDVAGALALVRDGVSPQELADFEADTAPYLDPIDMIVAGGTGDRTMRHDRLVIAIPGSE
jgi:hypothetical protein